MKIILSAALLLATLSANAQSYSDNYKRTNTNPVMPVAKSNLIVISPVGIAENGHTCLTLGYERQISKSAGVHLVLPVAFSYGVVDDYAGSTKLEHMIYFSPGIKAYFPKETRVRYGLGASLVAGFGNQINQNIYNPITGVYAYSTVSQDRFLLGGTIDNSFNAFISNSFYLGVQLSVGPSYFEKIKDNYQNLGAMAFFSMRLGYAF